MNRGRSGSRFIVNEHTIIKLDTTEYEARYLVEHPDVFVPVLDLHPLTMERWQDPDIPVDSSEALHAGFGLLEDHLWIQLAPHKTNWRELLRMHLTFQYSKYEMVFPRNLIDRLVDALPNVPTPVLIHGDPTLANIVYHPSREEWRWIDPLDRPYIPGDIHVDIGKMFQSLWGYELLLEYTNILPAFDMITAYDLCHSDTVHVSIEVAMHWCFIHMIRLLPYQDSNTRFRFEEALTCISSTSMVPS